MHDAKPNRTRNVAALTLVAVALAVMFVGAIMPTPLYPLYQHAFGFSGIIGLLSAAASALVAHVVFAAVITALAGVAALTGVKYPPVI